MPESIFRLDSSTPLPDEAGGKAEGIQLIMRAGCRSPSTWVVLPGARSSSLERLAHHLRGSGVSLLAVRSSARGEDGGSASFAGMHESRLGVLPEDLVEAVREVSESTRTDRAAAYRRDLGLPPSRSPCAVLVQELVPAEAAGIAFGTTGHSDGVVIEAVEGLGTTAVSGRAVPEAHLLHRRAGTWHTERRTPRVQSEATVLDAGRVTQVRRPGGESYDLLLAEEVAAEIAEGVRVLEALAGTPMDTEWALSGTELFFVQARPQTRPLTGALHPGEMWTRANIKDTYPEIPSAFARSLLPLVLDPGVRDYLRGCGTPVDSSIPMVASVLGRPIFNERISLPADLLGIPRSAIQVDFGGAIEADDEIGSADLRALLRHPVVLVRSVGTARTGAREASKWLEQVKAIGAELRAIDIPAESSSDLLEIMRSRATEIGRGMVRRAMALASTVSNAQYMALLLLRRHPTPRALLTRLVRGERRTVSTQQLDELVSLAGVLSDEEDSGSFTASVTTDHRDPTFWRKHLSPATWALVESWLERFGHRGPFESDIASPRYGEDLRLLARALFPLARAARGDPGMQDSTERADAGRHAWGEVETSWGRRHRRRIEKRVEILRDVLDLRERVRNEAVRVSYPLRRMGLELGIRLAREGRLEDAADVWHLSLDELERGMADAGYPLEVAVAREGSRRAAWRRVTVPNRFSSEELTTFSTAQILPSDVELFQPLRGNGVSPGLVEGVVRVIHSPEHAHLMAPGSVLVAPATDPGWTPMFARAVAVVVELGGALSHAGIVARELGIPCVANIQGVTRKLRDGDIVQVDGSAGLVTLMKRSTVRTR